MTPTQYLVLEVLAARVRCGESSWPFDNRLTSVLRALEGEGLVHYKSDVVEGTKRVWLTQAGEKLMLNSDYTPPILKRLGEIRHNHDDCAECIRREDSAYVRGRRDWNEYLLRVAEEARKP